jgi:molybdopterin molybdotransferase
MEKVRVKRPIGVSLISTGSEVLLPGQRLTHGKIYNNSAYIMASMIKKAALKGSDVSAVGDDLQLICGAIGEKAGASNIVITTGGVSVGKKDLMPEVLEKMGAQILFRGVDIQPGTPTIGAKLGDRILLCLSGNPFAALANFEVYFWEAAAALMGCDGLRPETGRAVMDSDYKKKNLHTRLIRAFVKDGRAYLPQSVHASSVVSNLISCNCMIELEKGRSLKAGDEVKIRYTH